MTNPKQPKVNNDQDAHSFYKPHLTKGASIAAGISLMALVLFVVYSKHSMLYSLIFGMVLSNGCLYLIGKQELVNLFTPPKAPVDYLRLAFLGLTNFSMTWLFRGILLIAFFLLNPIHVLLSGVFAIIAVYGLSVIFNNVILPWYRNDYGTTQATKVKRVSRMTLAIYGLRLMLTSMLVLTAVKIVAV